MADSNRLLYQLSQAESTLWQQGGPAALAFQYQLAELHRQGSLGLMPILDVLHPDGILAAQHLAYGPTEVQTTAQSMSSVASSQAQDTVQSQMSIPSPVRDLGRAEGSLIETSTVTAYQMSARESAAWSRGDHEARMVEANIGDALKDVTTSQPVAVLLDDGRAVYTRGDNVLQTMTDALGVLRDQLSALASGVQVHMDVSVQLGTPRGASQDTIGALQQRADQLTRPAPQRANTHGMSF
jgi:hypothetical protein